jgi:anti-anti-sigma factor
VEIFVDTGIGVATIELRGRLDADSAPALQTHLNEQIDSGALRLVLDLAHLTFTNSVGLRVLLTTAKRLSPLGGRIAVCCAQPVVLSVLESTGFDRVLEIHATRAEAIPSGG